jgi:hypothetical protein
VTVAMLGIPSAGAADPVVSLHLQAAPRFNVGAQTTIDDLCGFGNPYTYVRVPVTVGWSASASSGIKGYDVTLLDFIGGNPAVFQTAHNISWVADNYDGSCGGGSAEQWGWQVTAIDNAGETQTGTFSYSINLTRFDNTSGTGFTSGTWTFGSAWKVSTCLCADGGAQTFTRTKWAHGDWVETATAGGHAALVMPEGPGRGRARILVDGVLRATVDTYAAVNTNRVVVWDSGPLTAGTHHIRVVNLATPGHPRIDVNGMLTSQS